MPEERGMIIGGVEAEVRALRQDVTELKVDMAEVKGELRQMDKRLSNVETAIGGLRQEIGSLRQEASRDNRQVMWVVLGTWVTTMLAIISMSMTILSKLK
jgi:septal ring factor EnvC (AmiA/AmiB activator)